MKKLYILLITLVLINSALSLNAFAQSKYQTSNSLENVQGRVEHRGCKTSFIHSETNFGQTINHRIPEQRSLIQLNDSIYNWRWDTINIGWIVTKVTNIVYDANYNLTNEMYQYWNGSVWVNHGKNTFSYDANNNQISELIQDWNGNAWVNFSQKTYTYDANNNQTSGLHQIGNGNAWENDWQYFCTYDANNNQTSALGQGWNGSVWVNLGKNTFSYDANNNQTSELYQGWSVSGWVNNKQIIYTYDTNNNQTSALSQFWNGSTWDDSSQYTFTYDANNNQTSALSQFWNGSAWRNIKQLSYTYDGNNFKITSSARYWNFEGTQIIESDSTRNYFHTVVNGVNELTVSLESITVYPNPSSDKITFETPVEGYLSILNLNSQELITRQITEPKTQIDISTLPNGVYVVKLVGEKGVQVGKFIKQ